LQKNPLRLMNLATLDLPTRTHFNDIWEIGPVSLVCSRTFGTERQYDALLAQMEMLTGQIGVLRDPPRR
jgi:hypothetical protein